MCTCVMCMCMCVCVCVSFAEEPWKNKGFPSQKEPYKQMRNEGGREQDSSSAKDVSGSVCVCVCRREAEKREKCASNRRMELVTQRHGCFIGVALSRCHLHDSLYDSVTHFKTQMCHRGIHIYTNIYLCIYIHRQCNGHRGGTESLPPSRNTLRLCDSLEDTDVS